MSEEDLVKGVGGMAGDSSPAGGSSPAGTPADDVSQAELVRQFGDEFRDHDNGDHSLTLDNLKTLLKEAQMNGAMLYQQKWQIQEAIRKCGTLDELRKIEIVFRMEDFAHD